MSAKLQSRRYTLLCVAGPQMIIETICSMTDEPIDEIRVIASLADRDRRRLAEMCDTRGIRLIRFEEAPSPSESEVIIDPSRNLVSVGNRSVRLTPREMLFYSMFACFRAGGKTAVRLDDLKVEDFDCALRRLTRARGDETGLEECASISGFAFLEEMIKQLTSRSAKSDRDREDFRQKFRVAVSRIRGRFASAGLARSYAIALHREHGQAGYWLPVSPEKIIFLDPGNVAGRGGQAQAA
jgi:hypothetical protein